jgi:hypothetical protein
MGRASPKIDVGAEAVDLSVTMLRLNIDLAWAGRAGPNRGRLVKPFARGYIFGFSDACIQRFGVTDVMQSLSLITLVHIKVFGQEVGSLLAADTQGDTRDSEFIRGRTAGAGDLIRWLDDRAYTPLSLTDYLQSDDKPSAATAG